MTAALAGWLADLVLHHGRAISFADVSGRGNGTEEGCREALPTQNKPPQRGVRASAPMQGNSGITEPCHDLELKGPLRLLSPTISLKTPGHQVQHLQIHVFYLED